MARLDRYRGVSALTVLLSLAVRSWAQGQTSPGVAVPVSPAAPLGIAESAQQVQSEAAADVAMADSAAIAMANISGVAMAPTSPPVKAAPAAPYVGAPRGAVAAGTLQSSTAAPGAVQECKVLAGSAGKVMQVLLFVCSVTALIFKYRREPGDRKPLEFVMDSSKQLIGAAWIHVLNLCFATGLEAHFQAGDQCQWYWLNIMLDCTLGIAVEYVLMLLLTSCIKQTMPTQSSDLETGDYRGPGDGSCLPGKYLKQLCMWLVIVSLMKICMFAIMALGHQNLTSLAQAILKPFASDATLKLFVVMIFTPVTMNVFQFWMVDNFIKRQGKGENMSTGDMELDGSMRTRIQHGDM